jgi:hypothetical protein
MPRPQLNPTEDQRRLVKSMAAVGTPQEEIARKIGVRSPKTLRKYFREELALGSTEANYRVGQTLFQMATSGECPAATIFWAKTRNRFRERPSDDGRPTTPPPFIVTCEPGGPAYDHA